MKKALRPRNRGTFARFLSYVKPYTGAVIAASLGGVVKFTLPLFIPWTTKRLLDEVFPNPGLSPLEKMTATGLHIGILAALFLVLWSPMTYLRHYFAGKAGYRSVFDLRCDLYYRILRMSSSFFARNRSGGIVSRLMSDVALAQNLVGNALTNIWIDGAAVFVILYFIIKIDPLTALVALSLFPVYILFFKRIGGKIKSASHEVQQETEIFSGNIQEKIAGSVVVRAFSREKHEENRFSRQSDRLLTSTMRGVFLQSVNMVISGLITNMAPLLVLAFGGMRVISGDLTAGGLVALGMYLAPLYLPVQRFSELNVIFAGAMAALDRIFEIMDLDPEIKDSPAAADLPTMTGAVSFENVTFGYSPDAPVLREVSFQTEGNQKIALVGESGSGKSTFASLIPRFYDVASGSVRIDGHDVRDIKLASLRQHIGLVLQDPVLFSGTIRDNILYGEPKGTDEEVLAALRDANALDFALRLPEGLDTEVGERGIFLSGGQKQRLTIARAFLMDPRILILDEATSALDSESESLIQEALARLMWGRTTFIIAHRLGTIIHADLILVLSNGRLVESGTHEELVARRGAYHMLYEKQISGQPEPLES